MAWCESTLGDLVRRDGGLIQTGPFGSQLHQSDYRAEGIPVIMPKHIAAGRVLTDEVARVSEETAERLSRHKLRERAIVVPRRGEVTKRAFIRADQQGWLCGTGCLKVELNSQELLPEFLYYYMEQRHVARWLEQHAVGTTMLNLSASILGDLPVRYPETTIQHRIAATLTAYDDLIVNNQQRMKLLEEAARLLYQEWFARLKFPGHEHTPIVNGAPQGWSRRELRDVAAVNAKTLSGSFDGEIEYVDISSVLPGEITGSAKFDFRDAPSRARRIVRHGDIIWSCVRPNRRSYAMIWNPPENLIVSTGFAVITPISVPSAFIYFSTTTDAYVKRLENLARGAAYPAVLSSDFEASELLIPPSSLLETFSDVSTPIFSQLHNLKLQNQKLRAARDLLLPRLMSGELAV